MRADIMFSSNSDEWETPQELFDQLDKEFNFTLDPCATPLNAKCKKYYTKKENGLNISWRGERVFCNPPYGRAIGSWVKKCYEESREALIVMLIPARTDTSYFHNYIYKKQEIRFLRGRLKFSKSRNSAPFPSMIIVFRNSHRKEEKSQLKLEF